MIKQYEVEEIITRALEELNGVFSKPDEMGIVHYMKQL